MTTSNTSSPRNLAWLGPIGAGLMAVGTLFPWVKAATIFGAFEVDGTQYGDGKTVLVLGVAAAVIGFIGMSGPNQKAISAALAAAAVGGAISVYDLVNVTSRLGAVDGEGVAASVGEGLYLCAIGGVASVVGFVMVMRRAGIRFKLLEMSGEESAPPAT